MIKPDSHCANRQRVPAIVLMLLGTLLVGACGLGMSTEDRLQRAEQSLQSGENRAAIIDAKNVLVDEPENVRARLLLGKAALADGDGATAEKELRRAAELGAAQEDTIAGIARALLLQRKFDALVKEFEAELPSGDADRVALLTILGDARLALKQPELAREHYSRALELDANNPAAKLGTVQSYIAEGNPLQARATLSQVLDTNSDFAAAWLTSARLNMSSGNYAAGKKDFARAETIASGNGDADQRVRAIYGLAEASFATNELDEARKYSAQLDAIAGNSIAALQIAARLAYAEKDWNAAQEKLADILRRSPGDNAARVLLGAVHLQSGNLGQAEMYLSAAVADAPGNADARRLLAETRLQLNKSDEAQQALRPLVDTPDADPRSLAMAARVDMLSGNYAGAADFLERSVAENPATSGAELDLAIAYLLADRIEDAQRVLDAGSADDSPDAAFRRDALRVLTVSRKSGMDAAVDEGRALRDKWSSQPMAHVLFGSMLASTGRFDEARDALNAALAIAPDNVSALRFLARIEEHAGNYAGATARYRDILRQRSNDAHAMFALGRIAALNEQPDEAIAWLEKARAADTSAVAPRLVLSKLYVSAGRLADAEQVAEEGLGLNGSVADLHNTLGSVRLIQKRNDAAVKSFLQAVELDPQQEDYRINLSRAYAAAGESQKAISTLRSGSDDPLAHLPTGVMLANAQVSGGDLDAALQTARQLRRLHAGSVVPIALEAELLGHGGDIAGAIRAYDEALDLEINKRVAVRAHYWRQQAPAADAAQPLLRFLLQRPLDVDVRILLAQFYQQHSDETEAMAEYRRVLDTAPDNIVAVNNLAWLYFTNGDQRAEETARKAFELAPQNAAVMDTLGWILVRKNKLREGVDLLRKAAALADRPEVRYHLAAALAASGEVGDARSILKDILAQGAEFPSRNEAQTLLTSL